MSSRLDKYKREVIETSKDFKLARVAKELNTLRTDVHSTLEGIQNTLDSIVESMDNHNSNLIQDLDIGNELKYIYSELGSLRGKSEQV